MTTTATADVGDLLRSFQGDPQQAQDLAHFLGFDPIPNPQDQLAGASTTTLAQFFRSRDDQFGVSQLYRVGTRDAAPATAGLWVAVLSEWSHRSSDRDRTRRRISRALVELTTDRRNLAMLVPPADIDAREAELIFPRTPSIDADTTSRQSVTSIRALVDLDDPTRFHRDLIRDLAIPDGADLVQISRRWQEQFSVERVANRFYQEYADVRNRIADALVEANPAHTVVSSLTQRETRAWATRQMGRVLFLWFLQAKRWLGAPGGNGSPTYLRDLWSRRTNAPENEYYRGILVPLFFDAMATGNSTNEQNSLLGYVPYLNGGLFRRDPLEYRINDAGEVSLPDHVFDPARNDSLLGLLSRYRFTTRESTPDDQSVDPDPELLGRVFENLYQGDERHDTGTYYTAREIVHFMCRQALDGYLKDSVPDLQQTALDDLRENATGSHDETGSTPLDPQVAQRIIEALETVRICDPAVGSGAFLLGAAQEIITLRRGILFSRRDNVTLDDLYTSVSEWKQRIITYNLHGVDINPDAVEICRLRLWLSMVLDIPEPPESPSDWSLPNLDFRIVAGDSLIDRTPGVIFQESWPTPPEIQLTLDLKGRVSQLERAISMRKSEFDGTHRDPERLRELRELIDDAQREIIRLHLEEALAKAKDELELRRGIARGKNRESLAQQRVDHLETLLGSAEETIFALVQKPFLWPLTFPDVLRQGDPSAGFDIVLANPPYVRQERLDPMDQQAYAESFPEVYYGTADLMVYFYARAVQILRPGGWISFITSNSFTKRKYAEKLRSHLPDNLTITTLIDFGEVNIFDATVEPYVLVGRKAPPPDDATVNGHNLYPVLTRNIGRSANVAQVREELHQLPEYLNHEVSTFSQSTLRSSLWRIEDEDIHDLYQALMQRGQTLFDFTNGHIYRGLVTGLSQAFELSEAQRVTLIRSDPNSEHVIRPYLRGRNIRRWSQEYSALYIIAIQNSDDADATNAWRDATSEKEATEIFASAYPALHDHLRQYEPKLRVRQDRGRYWWELRACTYYNNFHPSKIVWPEFARSIRFSFDKTGSYMNNKCYFTPTEVVWLLAILNSELIEFLLCQIGNTPRGAFGQLYQHYMRQLPVVTPQPEQQRLLTEISETGITGEPVDQNQLDQIVYDLYGLGNAQINLIRNWFERRSLTVTPEDEVDETC